MSLTSPHSNGIKKPHTGKNYPGRPITEIIRSGFFTVNPQWTVQYWNKASEKLLGVLAKDIIGSNVWEKFSGMLPVNFYNTYHEAFLEDIPVHFTTYWPEKGAWFDVVTYYDDNILSVSFKRSHESALAEQLQQQLQALTELYKFITQVTNDCLFEWDLQTKRIFWIDGGHKKVFGYPIENAIVPQGFWENHIHPEDKSRVLTRLNAILGHGVENEWEEEYRFERASGDYAFVHDRAHIVYDENNCAIRMIGATQDITARKLTGLQLLESEREKQKEITSAVITAQETERSAIGREMHDNLNQILGAAKLYIELAKTDEINRQMCLEKSSTYIVKVIEEIRNISKTLVAPLKLLGLADSIQILIDDLTLVHLVFEFDHEGVDEGALEEKLQLDIFRMVQEQLNNIIKHAAATHVWIQLTQEPDEIVLLISDNGKGCGTSTEITGVGIINIKARAELHGGQVTIASKPGQGYGLKVVIPL